MNNIILGSGIIGLLAKVILGSNWKIIPFYKSRFYSFNPPLEDNFIIQNDRLDPFIRDITKEIKPTLHIYKRSWSIQGALIHEYNKNLCNDWLYKIFGSQIPPQSEIYMREQMQFPIYNVRVNQLYQSLINQFLPELKAEHKLGIPTEIGDHYIVRNGVREDFDNIISTIPLDVLFKIMGIHIDLSAKTLQYIHLQTDSLDFEGSNQLLVVDDVFDFFKATNIAPGRYLIYLHNEVQSPGAYFMNFIDNFEIIDGTSIVNAIPMGPMPDLSNIEKYGVYCVGSNAQWDWCADVGSCILRLLRFSQDNEVIKKRETKLD